MTFINSYVIGLGLVNSLLEWHPALYFFFLLNNLCQFSHTLLSNHILLLRCCGCQWLHFLWMRYGDKLSSIRPCSCNFFLPDVVIIHWILLKSHFVCAMCHPSTASIFFFMLTIRLYWYVLQYSVNIISVIIFFIFFCHGRGCRCCTTDSLFFSPFSHC